MTNPRPIEQVISIVELVILGAWFVAGVARVAGFDVYVIWPFLGSFYLLAFIALHGICTYQAIVGPAKHRVTGLLFGLFPISCAAVLFAMYQVFIALS